ncbi:MAG: translation initiation factor IF-2 associated domain-containing protein [Pseudomonadales bacterium]|nr:translation initiation factor IF-2 associated domain-containing protein [Pseudomonadales bacterium]MBO6594603.1 translation initiation factor IF-2 associated domain-containing protein [Pseudomonadales bacterium]MBO6821836.1 translation initiation factor IF-2 associated domain-containing protein [Pseudomonadales bacterium]
MEVKESIGQLAEKIGVPVGRLLLLLEEAGLYQRSAEEVITEDEKKTLLAFLKGSHAEDEGSHRKIALKPPASSTLKTDKSTDRRSTVEVEGRKKRNYVRRNTFDGEDVAQLSTEKSPRSAVRKTYDEETIPDGRHIGCVEWYGGSDSTKGRGNRFGFLDSVENGSVFVHESGLICSPLDMLEGRWVTFRIETTEKGLSAIDVDIAERDSDFSTILALLKNKNIPIKTRMRACFNVPLELEQPLIPMLRETFAEYDRVSSPLISDFPDAWYELDRESGIYNMLPDQVRGHRFNRQYPDIKRSIEILSNPERHIQREIDIYTSMSPQDKQLALSWAGSDSDYDKAKMLSARAAELVVAQHFSDLGMSVLDIAVHQVSGESDHWKSHDLLIDSAIPVDIKNARRTINSRTFVEYTIKRFKNDSLGRNVVIVGALSPNLTLDELERSSPWRGNRITVLGSTDRDSVQSLEQEYSQGELTVDFGDSHRWPIWIFNNDLESFPNQRNAIAKFSDCVNQVNPEDWNDCQINVIPAFLITGEEIPQSVRVGLLEWQSWYLDKIIEKSRCDELTLPWLYLFTFHHFLEAITNIRSADSKQYAPDGYLELLFYSKSNEQRPASLIDPLGVIKQLVEILTTLWDHRYSAQLLSIRDFSFKGEGLLRGRAPNGKRVTVLAYCGGFIEGKGKCGHSPLILGLHKTCSNCQMLICNKCGHCSDRCQQEKKGFILVKHM